MAPQQSGKSGAGEAQAGSAAADDDERAEIVVTGTSIRGVVPRSAPITRLDRQYIDSSGYATTQQLLNSLPQNFTGGPNEGLITGSRSASPLADGGGSINLRGLGPTSTLVLLNGHRLSPSGAGSFVDISGLPLSAIGRVDVMTDGASATYGSDAVAGVVNFVTRDDLNGGEVFARFGDASHGGLNEYQAGATYGVRSDSGRLLVAYEYNQRDALRPSSLPNTSGLSEPSDLMPRREQHSAIASGRLESGRATFSGDLIYQNRETTIDSNLFAAYGGRPSRSITHNESWGGSGKLEVELGEGWSIESSGTVSQTDSVSRNFAPPSPTQTSRLNTRNTLWGFTGQLNGRLGRLPGGVIRVAIGGAYQREGFKGDLGGIVADTHRDVAAVYGEAFLPVLSPENEVGFVHRLELSAAVRHESYSDFGSTTNPRFGIAWAPVQAVTLRSSYGRSFRAPTLYELSPSSMGNAIVAPDPLSPTGSSFTVYELGNNPNLQPQRATTWTAGIDIEPQGVPGLKVSATWFDIRYKNRIIAPAADQFAILADPQGFAPIIDRTPDPARIAALGALGFPRFYNFSALPLSAAQVFVDARLANLGSSHVSGIDGEIRYSFAIGGDKLTLIANATKLFDYEQTVTATSPIQYLLDTTYNPISFKGRATASYQSGGLTLSASANVKGSYRDTTNTGNVPAVATFDLSLQYDTGDRAPGFFKGIRVGLVALNVTDRAPPVITDLFGVNYDQENFSPLRRVVSVQLSKRW